MSRVKKASQRSKALPILGAAGLSLTLASGVSAAANRPAPDTSARDAVVNREITLREEEFFDVSLGLFMLSTKNARAASGSPAAVVVVVACSRERPRPRLETMPIHRLALVNGAQTCYEVSVTRRHDNAGMRLVSADHGWRSMSADRLPA